MTWTWTVALRGAAKLAPCLALIAALAPDSAQACGGTFCDVGPQTMPVDQSGENILFWIDESGPEPFTEAHIQIQYEGDAERFAWVIPVMEVPEVLVGSQALFENLLAATGPTLTLQSTTVGDCFSAEGFGCGVELAGSDRIDFADSGGTGLGGDEAGGTGGVEILDRGLAGAFEYVVLSGDNVDEVVEWLDVAGYAQNPAAPQILEEYLAEGFVFVAVKLRGGVGVDEIHPLAIRYPGTEPCIPIRLTRIAATPDMAIRAFFLGEGRVASSNWPHVEIDHAAIDWLGDAAASYLEVVGLAVDEAGGRAFVTEYAGTDEIVGQAGIYNPSWNPAAFAEAEAIEVSGLLSAQGLDWRCIWDGSEICSFGHPLIEPLLETYLPPPDSVDRYEFWNCLSCYEALIDLEAWDPAGFAADFDARIVSPGAHGIEMLDDAAYLTRLFTLLSPGEMIEDPLFHPVNNGEPVDTDTSATQVTNCEDEGPDYIELPGGRVLALDSAGNMPDLDLPAAERIVRIPAEGPAQVEVDNGPDIDAAIEDYNEDRRVGPEPWSCSTARMPAEGLLTLCCIFGVAFAQRRRRRA